MVKFDPNAAAAPGSGVFGLPFTEEESKVILIPVPWEVTTSYGGGTANGPEAIRKASMQVDLFDPNTGKPYEAGIFMCEAANEVIKLNTASRKRAQKIIDVGGDIGNSSTLRGNLNAVNRAGDILNGLVYEAVKCRLEQNKFVGLIGGDHSVSFGAIKAHAEKHPKMGILHIDAHADLRQAFEGFIWSHASIMYNVLSGVINLSKLVQVGIRDYCEAEATLAAQDKRIVMYTDRQLQSSRHDGRPWRLTCKDIVGHMPDEVYISFDIDGLDPTLCPHTGTPVPGGLHFQEVVTLLEELAARRRIVGFDLTEVAPGPDGNEWDANVGARILYKLIGYSLKSQEWHGK